MFDVRPDFENGRAAGWRGIKTNIERPNYLETGTNYLELFRDRHGSVSIPHRDTGLRRVLVVTEFKNRWFPSIVTMGRRPMSR